MLYLGYHFVKFLSIQLIKYELYWIFEETNKPRYTGALESITSIYEIQNKYTEAIHTFYRLIDCLINKWDYTDDDSVVI